MRCLYDVRVADVLSAWERDIKHFVSEKDNDEIYGSAAKFHSINSCRRC